MSDVKISIRDNGPALITGSFTVEDADGNQFDTAGRETIALCRCGASENRPFCDGAHNRCGFESAERAGSDSE
ncbi:MAG TPA: iron-binding protein [Planctomycetaceae bacterium]|mgnify:CR=1 FL=1|nr:iron-binding protein [Planctomycetaceae bacterium]